MVIRDTRRDEHYWNEFITFREELISISQNVITRSSVTESHRSSAFFNVFMHRLEVLLAHYSRGDDIQIMSSYFPNVIDSLEAYLRGAPHPFRFPSLEIYVQALWMLSFGILLDVQPPDKRRIAELVSYVGTDALVNRLRSSLVDSTYESKGLQYSEIYEPLLAVFRSSSEGQQILLQEYLRSYYSKMKPTYWHNRHLLKKKSYFGYWCVEAAVVVKLLGIDDEPFRDNVYYPADLVQARV